MSRPAREYLLAKMGREWLAANHFTDWLTLKQAKAIVAMEKSETAEQNAT